MKTQRLHGVTFYFRNFSHTFAPQVLRDIVRDAFPFICGWGHGTPTPKETMSDLIEQTGIRTITLVMIPRREVMDPKTDLSHLSNSVNIYAVQSCGNRDPQKTKIKNPTS